MSDLGRRVPTRPLGRSRYVLVNADYEAKLARGACADCGLPVTRETIAVFDWDHRDRDQKSVTVSWIVRSGPAQGMLPTLRAEIDKCDLRCANCHRLRTAREWHYGRAAAYPSPAETPGLFEVG